MLVSFIIPHKGREELLNQTIQSILDFEFDLQKIEIIVVTQNKTLECAHINQSVVPLKIIFRPEHETISTLRNIGVQHASGEYLAFVDADIQLSPSWLRIMLDELQANSKRVLVSAVQRVGPNARIIERIKVILNNTSVDSPVEFLTGRNLFMPRKVFQDVGGFPEHLVTCEDYYFTNKVHQIGEVYYTSKASYVHLGEDKNYPEMFRKEIWRGQANLRSLKGRRAVLREIPSIVIPLWQMMCFFIAVFSVFFGNIVLIMLSLMMFCLPILLYTLRLYYFGRKGIRFLNALGFYCVYFPARVIGTTIGVFRTIKV